MNRKDILIMNNIYDLTKKDLTKHSLCGMKDCTVLVRKNQLYILPTYDYEYFMEEVRVRNIKLVIRKK